MKPAACIAALVGGATGAMLWGAIARYTHWEVGYVAWGIGALVGFLAKRWGGQGRTTAMGCGLVALASIFGGKGIAASVGLQEQFQREVIPQVYQELVRGAKDYPPGASDAELAAYMRRHGFTEPVTGLDVSHEQLQAFRQGPGALLESFVEHVPSLAEFTGSPHIAAIQESVTSVRNITSTVKQSLGVLDMVFGALGVATAYQVVAGQEGDDGDEDDEDEEESDDHDDGDGAGEGGGD